MDLDALRARLSQAPSLEPTGRVTAVTGLAVRATLPGARVGDAVVIHRRGTPVLAEIVGFEHSEVVALPLDRLDGVGPEDVVVSTAAPLSVEVSETLLGRVLDGLGRPIDGGAPLTGARRVSVQRPPPAPLTRKAISEPLATGVRALDGFLTLGVGQRVGLFAGSGVGKSSLLACLARDAAADVVVVALTGERGREVGEFLQGPLASARSRTVAVVATSDAPALERVRAAQVATTIAEFFRDAGKRVLLLVDSVTRVARAQREVGLAAGEPPARRGYPPSVFAMLPGLLERAGQSAHGSITGVYTVLVENDDLDDPVADEVRAILDGHVVLHRTLAERGHFPAISIPLSVSRVMRAVASPAHVRAAEALRGALSLYEEKRDYILLGAYAAGSDPRLDRAVRVMPELEKLLRQADDTREPFEAIVAKVERLAARLQPASA